MQTGELVIATGLFQSQCSCSTTLELHRGQDCPPCPTCGNDAVWAFQRGTYRQPSTAGREASAAGHEAPSAAPGAAQQDDSRRQAP